MNDLSKETSSEELSLLSYPKTIIPKLKKWLGKDGTELFTGYRDEYETVSPVFMDEGIPHPVHFREGMQVRNFLRSLPECKKWTSEELDNNWVAIVEEAISEESKALQN